MTAGGEWGLYYSEAEWGLLTVDGVYTGKRKGYPFDESDGLIRRQSIIHSNRSHAYQTEYMFLNPGRIHFVFYSNANLDSKLFSRSASS